MVLFNSNLINLYLLLNSLSLSNSLGLFLNDEEIDDIVESKLIGINKTNHSKPSISKKNSNVTKPFYNINVGIDVDSLWYINASITNQDQQLRLDIAQPYVWVVNEEYANNFSGTTYEVNDTEVSSYYGTTVYDMEFIDNVAINTSAYISNMILQDAGDGAIDSIENSSSELIINRIGFFASYYSYSLMGAFGIGGKINNTNWQETQIATNYFNDSFLALEALKNEGTISSAGYSLWLAGDIGNEVDLSLYETNDTEYIFSNFSVGSLMLNYVNSTLYTGDLVKFESIPYYEVYDEGQSFTSNGYPIFPLSGAILIANDSETANLTLTDDITPILFDSRYTSSYLPIDIIQQISIQMNAFYVESVESWYVACELGNINAYIEFLFGQLSIKVPLSEFVIQAYLSSANSSDIPLYFKSATGQKSAACLLRLKPNYLSGINVLGSSFLRYAYLAADLEANEFALAQAANIYGEDVITETIVKRDVEAFTSMHLHEKRDSSSSSTAIMSSESIQSLSATTTTSSSSSTKTTTSSSHSSSTSSSLSSLSSSLLSSSDSSSTEDSTETALFISSGYIPFAKSSNISATSLVMTTFSASETQSKEYGSNILELFGYNFTYGSIFSNGEIVTATKSFYDTNLPSVTTKVSGSTHVTVVGSTSSSSYTDTSTSLISVYIVTTVYETQVTQVDESTTLYGTSTYTVYSTVFGNSTSTNGKNGGGSSPREYLNRSNWMFSILKVLGISGFIYTFI